MHMCFLKRMSCTLPPNSTHTAESHLYLNKRIHIRNHKLNCMLVYIQTERGGVHLYMPLHIYIYKIYFD